MQLSDFDYPLPKELIAQYPLEERDTARLLVLDRKRATIEHRIFKDIRDYLQAGDLLVLNNTKVTPSRLIGSRSTGGRVELLLLRQKSGLTFEALIRPHRLRLKEKIVFNGGKISAQISAKNEVTFSDADIDTVYNLGRMPLPPYIKRPPEDSDSIYYQTVYAKEEGSIASPTAGLHFTQELINKIKAIGVDIAYITLHINYSTFKPVKTEDISVHKMDKEFFQVSEEARQSIRQARLRKARIIAVGTTACRALESYASGNEAGETDLFIYPGYKFKAADALITNFHLPRTTLFMLACAFAGEGLIKKAYQEAIDKKYRFYSYGDAMLIV
ncbi:MAG: tRNA preQ1(34) S-adenosylmethionine ribosyltransferase-isomerase QueA [Candidatus Omnitrophica bacterium]|nr:tRNA preQ1(34) S-adenosylmethionine ribosyltransferase-isomerase QueA [Candidatus Omnitrophota bacterium]MDD5592379.1 tRNA preQ1(34) S-adenosylmethionine ribosyltransferase-isomerase QueA [Candidatus Omnitrophota bacterium]